MLKKFQSWRVTLRNPVIKRLHDKSLYLSLVKPKAEIVKMILPESVTGITGDKTACPNRRITTGLWITQPQRNNTDNLFSLPIIGGN